jgi:type II secretory ATPase GspE/PulE/Tfp pilus assembly ATPase PilB-like protein
VRRIGDACRVPADPDPGELLALGLDAEAPDVPLFRGQGCADCRGTGYRGRTGIYEMFVVTEDVRSLVLRKAPTGEIRRYATDHGMVTLRADGWRKALAGVTTLEEVLRVTQEEEK